MCTVLVTEPAGGLRMGHAVIICLAKLKSSGDAGDPAQFIAHPGQPVGLFFKCLSISSFVSI